MALNNYQFQFGSFVFGGAGSPFQILSVDGLEGLPELRSQDDNRGYNDGMFSGRDFLSGRTITMEINTFAGNGNSAQTNLNLLQAALLPQTSGTTLMQFQLSPSDPLRRLNARVRVGKTTVDPNYTYGFIRSQYTFFCPDPRYYDDSATTTSLTLGGALGRVYNRVYPLVYQTATGSSTTLTNNGYATTYPVITVNGPATTVTIGNVTTGQYLTINYQLAQSDSLVIDTDQKLVTINGLSARNLLNNGSAWFGLQPGANQILFSATNIVNGTTAASATFRSAYI